MPEDFPMALELYLTTMRPYTAELMVWDEARQRQSFASQWKVESTQVVVLGDRDIGWLQALETDSEIMLQQFFILPDHQRHGFGSQVLQQLLDRWEAARKPVVLTVLKNNPARALYERFGFAIVGEVGVKFEMKREPMPEGLGA